MRERTNQFAYRIAAVATILAAVACGGGERRAGTSDSAADTARDSVTAQGVQGMEGMGGMMSGRMMEDMGTHLRATQGASGDSLRAALPAYRQMLANMLAQMNREMRDMNMAADLAWDATVDSLRQDLTRMPELTPGELTAMTPAHRTRVERLMQAHRGMMGQTGAAPR